MRFLCCYTSTRATLTSDEDDDDIDEDPSSLPRRYTYEELRAATKMFTNVLGTGGFCSVFLGELPSGEQVAVKRLNVSRPRSRNSFLDELRLLGGIHHENVSKLSGFAITKHQRLVVYELVPNGSLERWLFNKKQEAGWLDWKARVKIAVGIARGLAYLHEKCSCRILHLDIKPQNILLDENLNPKICDFGLSKLLDRDGTSVKTQMRGTPGYLAPEWLWGSISEKVDVYSFGIVLLELLSGERCLDWSRDDSTKRHFPSWACSRISEGEMIQVIDEKLLDDDDFSGLDEARKLVDISLLCIQDDPSCRPSMGSVVQMLEGLQVNAT